VTHSYTRTEFTIPPDLTIGPGADVLPLAGEANWGMVWAGLDQLREAAAGQTLKIAGIDTGVDVRHPLLAPNVKGVIDFTGSPHGSMDVHDHGTHISGTIGATDPRIGVFPWCELYHGKGLGDGGSGSGRAIAAAMKWAADNGCDVISMSLGSSGEDTTITGLMRELAEQGIWIVAAAGNSGPNTGNIDWPGRSPYCVSVAALNPDFSPASFSSAGAKIDTAGPGVDIISCRAGGGFLTMSGTSMATPWVAGVLGLYRAAMTRLGRVIPGIDGVRRTLGIDSTDVYTVGIDRRTGPGALLPVLLVNNLTADPPPVG
jgi:subtilisin family serine protease